MTTFVPAEPFPPGEYIKDEIEARGWTQDDLADVIGISRRQIINLIQGKSGITPETAVSLADAFPGQDARTWMNLQVSFELAQAEQKDRDVKSRAAIFSKAPIRELKRRAWIPDVSGTDELESAVCEFLRIPSIDVTPDIRVSARKGSTYDTESPSERAWYCRAREMAESCPVARYDPERLEEGIHKLLELAAYPEDARNVPKLLADIGIRFVVVQHLKKTKIDGVAFWVNDSPVIAMSVRYDRIDNFWFTLLHEIVHIKNRDDPTVDRDIMATVGAPGLPIAEQRANRDAAEYLVPQSKLQSFIRRNKPLYYKTKIVQFAQARKVHPGIVVGQLQNRDELTFQQLRKQLVKIREHVLETALNDGWEG